MSILELKTKEGKVMYEIYKRLFAASTPSADFEELCVNAVIDERGRRHIPFMDYEIESNTMDNIIETILKEKRIRKTMRPQYKVAIYLGCSPKTKDSK